MEDITSKVKQTFQQFEVNKKFPEFLDRSRYLNDRLNKGESLVVKYEPFDSPGRFNVHDNKDAMCVYVQRKDGTEEVMLSLDVVGRMVCHDEKLFEFYESSD